MRYIKNYDQVYNQLLHRLKEYAEEHGAHFQGNQCNCIFPNCNHEHNDLHKSAGLVPGTDGTVLHCFVSNASGNIFTLAHEIEGLPLGGPEFFEVTIPTLAKRYGIHIEYEDKEVSKEEEEKLYILKLMDIVWKIATSNIPNKIVEYAEYRGLKKGQYGGVIDSDYFVKALKEYGMNGPNIEKYLMKGNLDYLFGNEEHPRILFKLVDSNGSLVGIASRSILENDNYPKYVNSVTTRVYNKSSFLFNFHIAKKFKSVYVVEGYMDAYTMINHNINNVVALGGTACTDEHLKILTSNFNEIIFALDNDTAGRTAMKKYVEQVLSKIDPEDKAIRVILTDTDPDEHIKKHGADKFLALEKLVPFEFELTFEDFSNNVLDKIKPYLNRIVNTDLPLFRSQMIKILAKYTKLPEQDIRESVDNLIKKREAKNKKVESRLVKDLINNLKNEKVDPLVVLEDYTTKIKGLRTSTTRDEMSYIDKITNIELYLKNKTQRKTISLGRFEMLNDVYDGLPRTGGFIGIGGNPSHGKSTLIRNLIYEIINANDDTAVLLYTLDDAFIVTVPIIVALKAGVPVYKVYKYENATREEKYQITMAFNWLKGMSNRLIIKDSSSFNEMLSAEMIEREIEQYKKNHPEYQPVVFIDSFHKLIGSVVQNYDMRQHFYTNAQVLKKISYNYEVPIITSLNYRKTSNKPTHQDIAESMQIYYELDSFIAMYNELQETVNTVYYWIDDNRVLKPIIQVNIDKNKIAGKLKFMLMKLDTERGYIEEVDPNHAYMIKTKQTSAANLLSNTQLKFGGI